jgi:hypothetical protein
MPVTFGTVQVVAPTSQGGSAPGGAGAGGAASDAGDRGAAPPPPRPREMVPVLRQLRDRANRLRAH